MNLKGYIYELEKPFRKKVWKTRPIILLVQSKAFKEDNLKAPAKTAKDLMEENKIEIRNAKRYPDIFHPNIWKSRKTENDVYEQIINQPKKN